MLKSSDMTQLDQLFCVIRREWVAALPEERVRQSIIHTMINDKGYPSANMALEKSLCQLPHLYHCRVPNRRSDILVFAKGLHPHYNLYPLLLIECKAVNLTDKVIRQVIGYNFYLKAPFIAIANAQEIRLGWYDSLLKNFRFVAGLPPYKDLLQQAHQSFNK